MSADLLTPEDMADLLGVSRAKVLEWNRRYEWPHIRLGRRIRWTKVQVEDITARHTVASATTALTDTRTKRSSAARRSA